MLKATEKEGGKEDRKKGGKKIREASTVVNLHTRKTNIRKRDVLCLWWKNRSQKLPMTQTIEATTGSEESSIDVCNKDYEFDCCAISL